MEPSVQKLSSLPEKTQPENFNWAENSAVKSLLDVVVSILAEEYVQTVKHNPNEFSNNGDPT